MKASLKFREDHHHHHHHHHQQQELQNPNQNQIQNPLVRAKIPISILGLPFISIVTAGDPSDLSFSLRTNYDNGPSLKLSYFPTTTTTFTTAAAHSDGYSNNFAVSLKSGVGFFGSPKDSPLVMSAQFNLFGNPNPSFSLQIKPQFGDFSLKKSALSAPLPNPNPNFPKENGTTTSHPADDIGVMLERPLIWRDLSSERNHGCGVDGFFSGVAVTAKTLLPLTKRAVMKFRWGLNFPEDFGLKKKLPFLTVDKIALERVEDVVVKPKPKQMKSENDGVGGLVGGDLEMVKGMCFWMRKEVEDLQKENRAMKESLEDMRLGSLKKSYRESENLSKKLSSPTNGNSTEFESWRSKKHGREDSARNEMKKQNGSESSMNHDVGEELKRAIEAANGFPANFLSELTTGRSQILSTHSSSSPESSISIEPILTPASSPMRFNPYKEELRDKRLGQRLDNSAS